MCLNLCVCGCRSNFANENDRLRAEVMDLQTQIDQARLRNAELEAAVRSVSAAPTTIPEDVRLNTPIAVELSIETLSFAKDTNGDGRADRLFLYLQPLDGLGRFVQVVGTLDLTAAIVPMQGEPATIARESLSPQQVRDAYRSGLTGTHYTLEIPLDVPADQSKIASADSCLVRLQFHNGLTGRTLTAERTIALK